MKEDHTRIKKGKGNPNPVRPDPTMIGEKNSMKAVGDMLDG